jgi:hypothetical protein
MIDVPARKHGNRVRVALAASLLGAFGATACGRTPDLQGRPRIGRQPATKLLPVFTQSVNNDIDILFLIDNSMSMKEEQDNLRRNFPVFTRVLKDLPQGLPNVHIAVVSSDLGAGKFKGIPGCVASGDAGRFQNLPRGACTPPNGSFIRAVGNERNFDGDIDQAFACIAALGTSGCGFEHQLQSLRVALDPELMPKENAGFLREHAVLALVLLTDEDDCSAPVGTGLFDPGDTLASDTLGPLTSFRCNEFGHLCDGRRVPRGEATNLQNCRSAEDDRLLKIEELVEFFKTLKADPNDVMVAAVAGPPTPYSTQLVRQQSRGGGGELQPQIVPSCKSANGTADPAIRIRDFVEAFGANGSLHSICADDFTPVMKGIGEEVARRASLECLGAPIADVDPDAAGVQARCEVFDETQFQGATLRELIPACSEAAPPCWRIQPSAKCAVSGIQMVVDRGGAAPVAGTRINVICETCESPSDLRCR